MQLKEILAIENDRTDVTKRVIHLFQEGSFYRAYEWSAWLCHRYINQFKVTHKQFRGVDTSVLFVGFPVTSLPKYFGDYSRQEVAEKAIDVVLPTNMVPEDMVDMMNTDYEDLPHDKSLFNSEEGCGLPIGNLTSQLFSNVYLGELDDFMKRELRCKHYGRYVDDFYVVSASREWLRSLVKSVKSFLREHLGLSLHEGKLKLLNVRQGVEFLGAYLKPWRMYVSNCCLKRMTRKIKALNKSVEVYDASRHEETFLRLRSSLNSFLGVLSHYKSKTLRTRLMYSMSCFFCYGKFDENVLRYYIL